ncbi:hypothetical protein HMPREF0762_02076 [Slackia exigua ATCC 700122]|uniref:Uncharacterized protein n=1 Tax=Slackia exigua (strain ATCC 700122 / DSM 15923 / CIP 105133 / JCM 11022 / KCTC 5966 / S-7) TaxID=649764 RepID=D0WJP9_SLAES|nr:hypothetical protein HMPREF0762_02076 [Slackia exigua ATCC 700122]
MNARSLTAALFGGETKHARRAESSSCRISLIDSFERFGPDARKEAADSSAASFD